MALKRILEPEIMDTVEDAQHYDSMNHNIVNQGFVDELIQLLKSDDKFSGRLGDTDGASIDVLDIGTANALLPVLLCQQHPLFRVVAIDMANSMLDLAARYIQSSQYCDRIELAKVDAKDMQYDPGEFDVVMCKSTIHHIPVPSQCLAEIVRVCKPGGAVFVRDLMRPTDEATLELIVQTYTGKESEYSQRLYRESLHAALSLDEIREMVSELGWDPGMVVATSDRHWTWAAIDR